MGERDNWRFGVVANICEIHVDEHGEIRYGSKAFSPGTKVYLAGKSWSSEHTEIYVIGRNRHGRIVLEMIPVEFIENVRTKKIFKPHVLKIIHYLEIADGWIWWGNTDDDRIDTQEFVAKWHEK